MESGNSKDGIFYEQKNDTNKTKRNNNNKFFVSKLRYITNILLLITF